MKNGLKYWLCSCYNSAPGILEDWSDLYDINSDGDITDKDNTPVPQYKGYGNYSRYLFVNLVREGKTYKRLVHRCVASSFDECGTYGEKYLVDHINSIPTDNRSCNLRWVKDQRENMRNPATQAKIKASREKNKEYYRSFWKDWKPEPLNKYDWW